MAKNIDRKSHELVIMKCYGPTCVLYEKFTKAEPCLGLPEEQKFHLV